VVYLYLCSYVGIDEVGNGDISVSPSRRHMQRDLGICANTLSKYLRELKDHGLIEVEQTRVLSGGKRVYGYNKYILRSHVNL